MFLKQVYQYNKWLFGAMCAFILAQLLVFYKGGMVFSPLFNYGMYAMKMKIDSAYPITYFPNLPGNKYSSQQWDKIYVTSQSFSQLAWNEQLYNHDIKRLYEKLHLPTPDKKHYTITLSETDYWNWYKNYLQATVKNDGIYSILPPRKAVFFWNGQSLTPQKN